MMFEPYADSIRPDGTLPGEHVETIDDRAIIVPDTIAQRHASSRRQGVARSADDALVAWRERGAAFTRR